MIKLILYALLIYVGYRVLKATGVLPFGRGKADEDREDGPATDADLIQDPQCGKFFMKSTGVTARQGGRTIHFCSDACRDAYIKRHESK